MYEAVTGFGVASQGGMVLADVFSTLWSYLLVFAGFSLVIFFHELGHFIAAKWCDVRVDKFAIGFGRAIVAWRKGIGLRWASTHADYRRRITEHAEEKRRQHGEVAGEPTDAELTQAAKDLKLGETEYCFNWLPLGGYVKMMGQEDFTVDKSGELRVKDNPRAFTHKPVGIRMIIVSAGVIMNLIFAALAFMVVFMIGTEVPPPVVGSLMKMESPAERAGLRPGDRILAINGQETRDFPDISSEVRLADPERPMEIVLERTDPDTGEVRQFTIEVQAEQNEERNLLELGIAPALNNIVADVREDPLLPPDEQLRVGDEILAVDGREISNFREVLAGLMQREGEFATLRVRRTLEDGGTEERDVKRRAYLTFRPGKDPRTDSGHMLGLIPRRSIILVNPGSRAELAGLQAGDVIARWGDQEAPRIDEILESIKTHSERDIKVEVLRFETGQGWKTVRTIVRPKPEGLLGQGRVMVGMSPFGQEADRPVVADIASEREQGTPTVAASLKDRMPRGALITRVDGEPVGSWKDVMERFREAAGREVTLAWRYRDGPEESGTIDVPDTLGTTFHLPADHMITKINGQTHVSVDRNGRKVRLAASNWAGASAILRDCVGQTIEVEHRGLLDSTAQVEKVDVTDDMVNTWMMRVTYQIEDMVTGIETVRQRELNPFKAMMIGVRKTYYFVEQIYRMVQRMVVSRSVGFDQVSGPIGIVQIGSQVAEHDPVRLLYFLAVISANLALINFLPLPIVDGGLFVFLIIEKIKGGPIPMKVQIATQLIGLCLIIGVFLYVTFNDIQRILG